MAHTCKPIVPLLMTIIASVTAVAGSRGPDASEQLVAAAADGTVATVTGGTHLAIEVAGKEIFVQEARPGSSIGWPAASSSGRDVAIAWVDGNGETSRVMVATGRDGNLSAPRAVTPAATRHARFPSVAIGVDGETWIAYVDGVLAGDDVMAVRLGETATSTPLRVSDRDDSEDLVPQIAMDAAGSVVVVWAGYDGHDDEILWSRFQDGAFTPEARVHANNPFPDLTPSMTRGGDARLHAAWSGFDGSSYQVFTSAWDGKAWTPAVLVSSGEGAATLPRVTATTDGALLLWNQYDGKVSHVGAARVVDATYARLQAGGTIPLSFKPAAVRDREGMAVLTPSPDAASPRRVQLEPAR